MYLTDSPCTQSWGVDSLCRSDSTSHRLIINYLFMGEQSSNVDTDMYLSYHDFIEDNVPK